MVRVSPELSKENVALCRLLLFVRIVIVASVKSGKFTLQFGQVIREVREERGISQEQLAFVAGLHRTHISLIETGQRSVRIETVYRLALALGVQPSKLMPTIVLPPRAKRP